METSLITLSVSDALWIFAGIAAVAAFVIAYLLRQLRRSRQDAEARQAEARETLERIKATASPPAPTSGTASDLVPAPRATAAPALYLQELELKNIRCFKHCLISLAPETDLHRRTLILGDNAAGKSTLLRSIALGLCSESDAIALMKAWPGPLIREGQESGEIRIGLTDGTTGNTHEILSSIARLPDGTETIRQVTKPPSGFAWQSIFVCGYGTQRTKAASQSFERYSPRHAVSTLFDDQSVLQNPEVVLLRQHPELRQRLQDKLREILLLDAASDGIEQTNAGLQVRGPWGSVPFRALSDGYRSTTQWLMDLFSWLILAERMSGQEEPEGILLIDEIEQHLHPRWQRYVVQRLSEQLPRVQIVATTHTPLVASGMADVASSVLLKLTRHEGDIAVTPIQPSVLRGKRADQVLTELFELLTSRNPGSSDDLARFVQLRSKPQRDTAEEDELRRLEEDLASGLQFGETPFERNVDKAVSLTLDSMLRSAPSQELTHEVKRQLRELFREDKESS